MANRNTNVNDSTNSESLKWWRPGKIEKFMLWLTIATVVVSLVSNAGSIVSNVKQFDSIYMKLYPFLNLLHIAVLFYIIANLRDIKEFLPSNEHPTSEDNTNSFFSKLEKWIKQHSGSRNWKYWVDEKKDDYDYDHIKKLIKDTNTNIQNTHIYFLGIFGCYIFLYVFELINSVTSAVNEPVLHILTIIFNNISTLLWFYVYLTFSQTKTNIELSQENIKRDDKNKFEKIQNIKFNKRLYKVIRCITITFAKVFKHPNKGSKYEESKKYKIYWEKYEVKYYTCIYKINRWGYRVIRCISFAKAFNRPDKYYLYEKGKDKKDKKQKTIKISKIFNAKFLGLVVLILSIIACVWFISFFREQHILEIEKMQKVTSNGYNYHYYLFRIFSTVCIFLGGCAMLASFSRLSSGFHKVPFSAFLILIFYAALQPLFFAGNEFDAASMKIGQMMFIVNALCLIGKFGLLHLIKWFFGNYHIAYYFFAGQIVKDNSENMGKGIKEFFSTTTEDKKKDITT